PSATSTIAATSTAFVAAMNDSHPVRDSHDDNTSHVRSRVHPSASHHGAQNPSMMITACRIHRNLYSNLVAPIKAAPILGSICLQVTTKGPLPLPLPLLLPFLLSSPKGICLCLCLYLYLIHSLPLTTSYRPGRLLTISFPPP